MNPEKYERIDVTLPAPLLKEFSERCEAQWLPLEVCEPTSF